MPSIDTARRRVRLSDSHISVLGLLIEQDELPAELSQSLTELQVAGIVDDERVISGDLFPLVSTLLEPRVIIRTENTGPQGVVTSGAVIGDDFVFAHEGWPGESESEYIPVEAPMLVWALARSVDLHGETAVVPDAAEEITSTMGVLDTLLAQAESERSEDFDFAAAGRAAGAPPRLAEVLAQLNSMWRTTVVWRDAQAENPEPTIRALAVWDCGMEGYWIREEPAEPVREGQVDATSPLRIRRSTAKELWQMITDLLPDGDQLG